MSIYSIDVGILVNVSFVHIGLSIEYKHTNKNFPNVNACLVHNKTVTKCNPKV